MQAKALEAPNGKPLGAAIGGVSVMNGVAINGQIAALVDTHIALLDPSKAAATPQVRTTAAGEAVCRIAPAPQKAAQNGTAKSGDAAAGGAEAGVLPRHEMYVQAGKPATRGKEYEAARAAPRGGACVVLGAGNQAFLGMADTLNKMFLENYPVVLKHHDAQVRRWSFKSPPVVLGVSRPSLDGVHASGNGLAVRRHGGCLCEGPPAPPAATQTMLKACAS